MTRILTPVEVDAIEARHDPLFDASLWDTYSTDIPALIATVRAAWAENKALRAVAEWAGLMQGAGDLHGSLYADDMAEALRLAAIALARGVLVTDWDTAAAYDILERAYIAAQPAAPATEEEARVHAVIDTSHRRMLARVSQEEPENCTRCSFKRTNPHQHPGDPWPWNAAPATEAAP